MAVLKLGWEGWTESLGFSKEEQRKASCLVTGRASRLSGGNPRQVGSPARQGTQHRFPTAMGAPRESQRAPCQVPQPELARTLCLELYWAQQEGEERQGSEVLSLAWAWADRRLSSKSTPLCRGRQGSQASPAPGSHVGKGRVHHCPPSGLNKPARGRGMLTRREM